MLFLTGGAKSSHNLFKYHFGPAFTATTEREGGGGGRVCLAAPPANQLSPSKVVYK